MMNNRLRQFAFASIAGVILTASGSTAQAQEQTSARRAAARIAVQEVCPVSGNPLPRGKQLASITDPDTKERFYVCCEGCESGTLDKEVVSAIHGRYAKAQKHCLVMTDNEVTAESKSSIIQGHRVFICCPPCTKKMDRDPAKYLTALDNLYEAAVKK